MESEMSGVNVEKSIGAVDFAVFIGIMLLDDLSKFRTSITCILCFVRSHIYVQTTNVLIHDRSDHYFFISLLAGMLVLSSSIGIYFGYRDRRKTNSNSYYFGGKAMNPVKCGVHFPFIRNIRFFFLLTLVKI